jgi:hypothetical protein
MRVSSSLDALFMGYRAIAGEVDDADEVLVVTGEDEVAIGAVIDGHSMLSPVLDSLDHLAGGKVDDTDSLLPSVGQESVVRGEVKGAQTTVGLGVSTSLGIKHHLPACDVVHSNVVSAIADGHHFSVGRDLNVRDIFVSL